MSGLRDIHEAGIAVFAAAHGLRATDFHDRAWTPCPWCGARERGSRDCRGPVGVTADGMGCRCHVCGAGGDAVELARAVLGSPGRPASCEEVLRVGGEPSSLSMPLPSQHRRHEPVRPPMHEVLGLWNRSKPVCADEEVATWLLKARGLEPEAVDLWQLARALPRDLSLPGWAFYGNRSWTSLGYRLLLPLFSPDGRMESIRARRIVNKGELPKEVPPYGRRNGSFEVRGLVFAEPLARLWLGRKPLGDGSDASEAVRRYGLLVTEGSPDFLTACERWVSDAREDAPAVVGLFSGSWTAEFAERVPEATAVCVLQQEDENRAGEKYFERVRDSLRGRARVSRLRLKGGT